MEFQDDLSGNIRFSAELPLNDFGEPSDYVTHVLAKIQQYADEEYDELVEAGNVSLAIVRIGDAYERSYVKDAFDESASLFSFYRHVWNDEEDWFVGKLDLNPHGLELLIVDRIYLEPTYRGQGLGKSALQHTRWQSNIARFLFAVCRQRLGLLHFLIGIDSEAYLAPLKHIGDQRGREKRPVKYYWNCHKS
jgi:GNAT superfamily N-acetyltransferase